MIADSVRYLKVTGPRSDLRRRALFRRLRGRPRLCPADPGRRRRGGRRCAGPVRHQRWRVAFDRERSRWPRCEQATTLPLGIHAHNDGEMAVANTLVGRRGRCVHVQGTINGYGERCGNANLCSIIPDLQLKMGHDCVSDEQLHSPDRDGPLRQRTGQSEPGCPSALRGPQRLCPQGRHARQRPAQVRGELPAHRSGAGRQPQAGRRLRAVGQEQHRLQGRRIWPGAGQMAAEQNQQVLEQHQRAGEPGLPVRGRRGLGGAADPPRPAGLRAAL